MLSSHWLRFVHSALLWISSFSWQVHSAFSPVIPSIISFVYFLNKLTVRVVIYLGRQTTFMGMKLNKKCLNRYQFSPKCLDLSTRLLLRRKWIDSDQCFCWQNQWVMRLNHSFFIWIWMSGKWRFKHWTDKLWRLSLLLVDLGSPNTILSTNQNSIRSHVTQAVANERRAGSDNKIFWAQLYLGRSPST